MGSGFLLRKHCRITCAVLVAALSCFRLAHIHLLWSDEDYHLAAAIQMVQGRMPYRDFWYDKPPLNAVYYLMIGGYYGWPLRILDAAYIGLACYLAYRLARCLSDEQESFAAALLFAFFTTFYLPSAVIPFAADALMLLPQLAAVYCAARKRALWAGAWAGVAFWVNPKALFVIAVCAFWIGSDWWLAIAGFGILLLAGFLLIVGFGAWNGYVEQVWRWGLLYTKASPVRYPLALGSIRTGDWLGFHAALALGLLFGFQRMTREHRWKLGLWLVLSFAAVCLGTQFAPRYFLQLLPAMVIVASPGIVIALRSNRKPAITVLALALAAPLIRFGPRYATLAYDNIVGRDPNWVDVGMDLDSRAAAQKLHELSRPGDTLFVWGYRPDIYVYSRMVPSGMFWDSQPLTGVPADRHLHTTNAIYSGQAVANREKLIRSDPTFLVDGLSLLNPKLTPGVYPELRPWLADYRLVGETKLCLIYRRKD